MAIISNTKIANELGLTAGEVKVLAKKMPKTKIGFMKVSSENFMVDKDKFMDELERLHTRRMVTFSNKSAAGKKAAEKRWAEHNRLKEKAAHPIEKLAAKQRAKIKNK